MGDELSRRGLLTLGLSRLLERPEPDRAATTVAEAARAWPRGDAELWAPIARTLPRPERGRVLDADDAAIEDLAALAFDDGAFDAAVSAFGPMFASDGRAAIDELFRVVRPGGSVAFAAWTPLGVVGRLLRLAAAHDPPRPGVAPPLAWGREERLRQELDRHSDDATIAHASLPLRFASCEDALRRLMDALGPLGAAPRQAVLRERARTLVGELAVRGEHGVTLEARHLVVRASRRSGGPSILPDSSCPR
jgi:SAM-dependent methyltransferase